LTRLVRGASGIGVQKAPLAQNLRFAPADGARGAASHVPQARDRRRRNAEFGGKGAGAPAGTRFCRSFRDHLE
jgi:hypothetical protein